jgi:protein SCO1
MSPRRTLPMCVALSICAVLAPVAFASAQQAAPGSTAPLENRAPLEDTPPGLENVGVDEHIGREIPLDLGFLDHRGRRVALRDLIRADRPVVINLVYHSCPSSCSLVLDATVAALSAQPWTIGEEYDVITVSIDPRDTPARAARRRREILARYGRGNDVPWHFLVPTERMTEHELVAAYGVSREAESLAEALGFRYAWMPREAQFAHAAVIMVLTPEARVARYLYGLEYPSTDVRVALLEASEGRGISTIERAMLYCYQYDAGEQKYVIAAWRVMQFGGALTAILLFVFLAFMWRRELKRRAPREREDLRLVRS